MTRSCGGRGLPPLCHRSPSTGVDEEEGPSWVFDPTPGPEDTLLFRERQKRLWRVMQALPKNDQACLRLRAEGLRYREIAEVVGISLGSVSNSLARSLERLARTDGR